MNLLSKIEMINKKLENKLFPNDESFNTRIVLFEKTDKLFIARLKLMNELKELTSAENAGKMLMIFNEE